MEEPLHPQKPILLVDDEPQFLQSVSFTLRSSGYNNIQACQDSREAMAILSRQQYCVAVLDLMMPYVTGKDLLKEISQAYPELPVIMLTALNEVEPAVECIRLGALDYLIKPIDKKRLVTTVQRAIEYNELKSENSLLKKSLLSDALQTPEAFEDIVTRSRSMHSIFKYIEAASKTSMPVLITGETGSGKEMIAKSVHTSSGRAGAFVPVNAAGLDDALFCDTLFGHEKGAFTGADRKREGLIAKAAKGTVFLDEIGDLKMESQVKLLRVLEERTYYPVGSDIPLRTDAKFVVATNRDLGVLMKEGSFRSDLYYRLQSHTLHVPPLRDRREDIPVLFDFFADLAAGELGKKAPTPPPELFILLSSHDFPGNVRELKSMVFDAISRHTSGILSMETFKSRLNQTDGAARQSTACADGKMFLPEVLPTLKESEEMLVSEALKRAQGNQTIAARMLGLTRSALNKRLNRTPD